MYIDKAMKSNSKLLSVNRSLNIYDRTKKSLLNEIPIVLSLEEIKQIVEPEPDDPLLYSGYLLTEEQLKHFSSKLNEKIVVDLQSKYYVLEAIGVYD